MSDKNNPMKPFYEKPRRGEQTYRDKTADEAIGRADKARKHPWVLKPQWGPNWRNDD